LDMRSNHALTNLDGLRSLTNVGGNFYISYNNALTNCQGIAPVLGWPNGPPDDSVDGSIDISQNNGTECDSIEAVLASVSGPSQPAINTATGGNESISLGFSLSTTTDTLFPVTSYEAVCSGLTEIETAIGIGSPINVGNLTNFREYACTIAPVTGLGTLPLSSSVSATPMPVTEAPSAPQITDIEPGNAQITISVSVADDGGSPITSYTGYCFGDTFSFGSSPTSPITVSGLTNGEAYECLVTATNDVGTSPLSLISAPVTPVAPAPGC
jgi:titin